MIIHCLNSNCFQPKPTLYCHTDWWLPLGLWESVHLNCPSLPTFPKTIVSFLRWPWRCDSSSHHCRLVAIVGLVGSSSQGSKFIVLGFLLSGSTTLAVDEIVPPSADIEAICSTICSSSSCCHQIVGQILYMALIALHSQVVGRYAWGACTWRVCGWTLRVSSSCPSYLSGQICLLIVLTLMIWPGMPMNGSPVIVSRPSQIPLQNRGSNLGCVLKVGIMYRTVSAISHRGALWSSPQRLWKLVWQSLCTAYLLSRYAACLIIQGTIGCWLLIVSL